MAKRLAVGTINLFVLTGARESREVRRAPLEQTLQAEMSKHFAKMYAENFQDDHEVVAFDPSYRPEDGELFEIDPFQPPKAIKDALKSPTSPAVVSKEEIESSSVRALMAVDATSGAALFQHVDAAMVIRRRTFSIILSKDHFAKRDQTGLVVREQLDAVIIGTSLRFSSFHWASRMFDLADQFQAATDADIRTFLGHDALAEVKADLLLAAADSWCRHKFTAIREGGVLDNVPVAVIEKAAARCGVDLTFAGKGKNRKIVLPTTRRELKKALRLLDDDYLDSQLTADTTFQVNSKRKLTP